MLKASHLADNWHVATALDHLAVDPTRRPGVTRPVVLATMSGRVRSATLDEMAAAYAKLGGGPVWMVDGVALTSYGAEAIRRAVDLFGGLADATRHARPLRLLAAALRAPLVVLGARTVSASLAVAGSPLRIEVVASLEHARLAAARWLREADAAASAAQNKR
jgi:hypothetical protein